MLLHLKAEIILLFGNEIFHIKASSKLILLQGLLPVMAWVSVKAGTENTWELCSCRLWYCYVLSLFVLQ
jgi:hypothetical protein